jgi:hypothetical protein
MNYTYLSEGILLYSGKFPLRQMRETEKRNDMHTDTIDLFLLKENLLLNSYQIIIYYIKLELFCSCDLLVLTGKGCINKIASALAGNDIRGDAMLVYGFEGRILYYQLRPEFVKSYKCRLNPDAVNFVHQFFTSQHSSSISHTNVIIIIIQCFGFGKEDIKIHNQEVQEATAYLTQIVIPK